MRCKSASWSKWPSPTRSLARSTDGDLNPALRLAQLSMANKPGAIYALLVIDVDHFKEINDTHTMWWGICVEKLSGRVK